MASTLLQEIYYYVGQGNQVQAENITSDATTVKGVEKGNRELVEVLTTEGGVLAAGVLPAPATASDEGQRALLDSLGEAVVPAPKKKAKTNTTNTEKAEPKGFEEFLDFNV